ncbi:MAG: cupin domain-containing protein [Sedimentisphaerales bacterium]|nr:cupin domain-containing protein [Sedimentisphaerales bacterium]
MAKGIVVKIDKVMPFSPPEFKGEYVSKMLIDVYNAGSDRMQVNHGVVKAGCGTPGAVHESPHDEIYIVLSGSAVLHMDGVDYDIEKGSVVFIPGGTFHSLKNKSETEDFEIITVWPGQPKPGANEVYDMRKEQWGTTYREIE